MQPQQILRIRIENLPPIEQLTVEEVAVIFGAGRARLEVEALESRELMASSLMAGLSGGVLRVEGTNSADTIRVSQVGDQISVINVQTGGTVASFSTGSVTRIEIQPLGGSDAIWLGDVGKMLSAPVSLTDGLAGDSLAIQGSTAISAAPTDAVKLLVRNNGTTFTLHSDGWVSVNGNRTWAGIRDIALYPDQALMVHYPNGVVERLPVGGSWREVASGADKVALRADGALFTLNASDGWVSHNGVRLTSNVKEMVLAADQSLYTLHNNGDLQQFHPKAGTPGYPLSGQRLDTNVQAFAVAPDGAVFTLDTGNNLYKFATATPGQYIRLDINVVRFAVGRDGSVFTQDTGNNLYKFATATPGQYVRLDTNVQAFAVAPDGAVLTLDTGNRLYKFPTATPGQYHLVAGDVWGVAASNTSALLQWTGKERLQSLSRDDLKRTLAGFAPDYLKTALQSIDRSTLKVALETMTAERLKLALGIIDEATLKVGLEAVDAATLKVGLASMDAPRLKLALQVIDAATLNVALPGMTATRLGEALGLIGNGRLVQAGTKLFFRNAESYLMALDTATNTVVNFNGASRISDFAVLDGKVYIREMDPDSSGVRPLIRRALDGMWEGRYAYVQGGTKLFFRNNESLLMALDTSTNTVVKFNGNDPVTDFAVEGARVYIWETKPNDLGVRPLICRNLDGVLQGGAITYQQVGGKLFFIALNATGRYDLMSFETSSGTLTTFATGVKSFGVDGGWLTMQREEGTLFQQMWNSTTAGPNISCKVVGTDLFYLDRGADGHYYLKVFDARIGMSDYVRTFASQIKSFGVDGGWLTVQREDGTLFQKTWNGTTTGPNISCKVVGTDLFYLDRGADGHYYLKVFDARLGMSDTVRTFASQIKSFGVDSSWLVMLREDGTLYMQQWNNPVSRTGDINVQQADSRVFYLDGGYLCTFDATTGKSGVVQRVRDYKVQWFAVRGDHLYFITEKNNTLYHVHASNPAQPWLSNDPPPELRGFFSSGGFLYTLQDNLVRRLDLDTGGTDWAESGVYAFQVGGQLAVLSGSVDTWTQISALSQGEVQYGPNGEAFFLNNEGYLCTIGTTGGKVGAQERVTAYQVQWFAVRGDHLYFITELNDTLYHVHASNPAQPWVINDPAPELRGFFASGDYLYTLQKDNRVRSLNLDTGATQFGDVRVNGFTLSGDIARKWLELGGASSNLGLPTGPVVTVGSDLAQHFQRGGIFVVGGQVYVIGDSALWPRYLAEGGESGPLGLPLDSGFDLGNGWYGHQFQHGTIFVNGQQTQVARDFNLSGDIALKWLDLGGDRGPLGKPLGNAFPTAGGGAQHFPNGTLTVKDGETRGLYWTADHGTSAQEGVERAVADALQALRTNRDYLRSYIDLLARGETLDLKGTEFGRAVERSLQNWKMGNEGSVTLEEFSVHLAPDSIDPFGVFKYDDLEVRIVVTHKARHSWGPGLTVDVTNRLDTTTKLGQMAIAIVSAIGSPNPAAWIGLVNAARVKHDISVQGSHYERIFDSIWFKPLADAWNIYEKWDKYVEQGKGAEYLEDAGEYLDQAGEYLGL